MHTGRRIGPATWRGPESVTAHHTVSMTQQNTEIPTNAPSDNYKWKAFSVMALGLFFGVMDFGGTGVAIPTIADEFGLALGKASLIALGFAIAISAVLLPIGGISDLVGRKRSFITGGILYAIGAAIAAVAPDVSILVAGRIISAIGAATVMANGMAIVAVVFPAEERGKGMGLITSAVGLGSVAGPLVAGAMVDSLGWRSFFVLLAIGTGASVVWASIILDEEKIGTPRKGSIKGYDWTGALISAVALTVLILAATFSTDLSPFIIGPAFGLTAILLYLFIRRESRIEFPLFDLGMFKNTQFSWAISARFLGFVGSSPWFFLMPFYLQGVRGYSPSEMGPILIPGAIGFAIMGSMSGRMSDKFGVKPFTVSGLILVTLSGLVLASLNEESELYIIMPALFGTGLGMGLWVAPNMSAAISAVQSQSFGVVSAFINLIRNTASAIAIAVATAIVVGVMTSKGLNADLGALKDGSGVAEKAAFVSGMRIAFLAFAGVSFLAIIAAMKTENPIIATRRGSGQTAAQTLANTPTTNGFSTESQSSTESTGD
jgi:MFS family permease